MASKSTASTATISVDAFYDKQKELYDICGNLIHKDKYPFVDVLSRYLTDIVGLIDIEIKNSARNSMINWREKKNPKLLSRLINNDDNVNLINISMNKITGTNYKNIVAEITDALLADNYRKLPDYCKYLFDSVIKKCMSDEAFTKDYIRFLFGFSDGIGKNLREHIDLFVNEVGKFLNTNDNIKDYAYFYYVKDVAMYRNVGVILANIFQFQLGGVLDGKKLCSYLEEQFGILYNYLDWLPVNMDELNGRLYLVLGIMELLINDIWFIFSDRSRVLFSDILKMSYSCASIPNKIKFKVLDLQDMIKNMKPIESTNSKTVEHTKAIIPDVAVTSTPVPTPVPVLTPVPMPVQTQSPLPTTVNIWESRKQTMQNTMVTVKPSIDVVDNKNNEDSEPVQTSSRRYRGKQGGRVGERRNRGGKDNHNGEKVIAVMNETSKNMFSGLDTHEDSNNQNSGIVVEQAENTVKDDDGFITVEKKVKNVYKPKKTPSLAVEGGMIYNAKSTGNSNSNHSSSRRK